MKRNALITVMALALILAAAPAFAGPVPSKTADAQTLAARDADLAKVSSVLEISAVVAALEAQACEVPVIATRIGGIPEVVSEGETGYLSDVGDVQKMSDDTLRLLGDEELRRSFGEKGRELAVQRYGSDKIIPQYIAFYEQVVGRAASQTVPASSTVR